MSTQTIYAKASLLVAAFIALTGVVHLAMPQVSLLNSVCLIIETLWLFITTIWLAGKPGKLMRASRILFGVYLLSTVAITLGSILTIGNNHPFAWLRWLREHPEPRYWADIAFALVWMILNFILMKKSGAQSNFAPPIEQSTGTPQA